MSLIIALLRIALVAVFGVAGITKLLDQRGTREAVENFGAPKPVAPAIAILLPLLELAAAAGLLFSRTAWWSALGALLLLGFFVVAISVNLALGRTPDCHCFGQLHSRPLGWPTLVRNIIFGLGAGVVLWAGNESNLHIVPTISEALARLTAVQSLLLVVAIFVAAGVLVHLQRRQKSPAENAHIKRGLPLDSAAPPFDLPDYEGGTKSLSHLLAEGKPVLLIFTSPKCPPCVAIFKEIKEWQDAHNDQLTIALISSGTIKENFVNVARNRLGQVLLQEKREVGQQYGATATPTAVVVSTDGLIASHVAGGAREIRELLKALVGNSHLSNVQNSSRSGSIEQLRPEADSPV
jgi:methylamine dehydrogenase accessory protein MauD